MTQNPHDTQKDIEKSFLSKDRRKVALKSPKCPLIRDISGDLRATFFVWEMLVLDRRAFCFRGWKSPQGLYNRSKTYLFSRPDVCVAVRLEEASPWRESTKSYMPLEAQRRDAPHIVPYPFNIGCTPKGAYGNTAF